MTYENKIKRAMNFALSIKKELNNEIKIGMTFGITYCGLLGNNTRSEYTCLGDIVNLSARLMSAAKFGNIWINYGLAENIKNEYEIIQIGSKKIKGKSEKVQIYELVSQKQSVTFNQYFSPMIGRDKELNKIKNFIEGIKDKKKSSILYIYGEAGIGKSRLIYEATKDIKEDFFIFTLQADSIIKNSLNAFEYFFKKYFNLDLAKDENEKKILFEKKYDELIEKLSQIKDLKVNKLVKELIRTRSFI
ncbi:MAG: adenylate/guanylate cyclase domain-containing protein, partial [Spirochaetota bacterium]